MAVETQPRPVITVQKAGVSLLLILVAIICFVVAALGVGSKLGFDIVDLGLAAFAASFVF